MDKVRLNNFILWCKGWYEPTKSMVIIAQAQKTLVLDGYLPCNNPIAISLTYMDDLVKQGLIKPIKLVVWNEEIVKYMSIYDMNYNTAMMYRIKNFFAFECPNLSLEPPVYSRKVYKLGFKSPSQLGNSYTLANYKSKKLFK